jgi:DNA-binding MarR family transcriptional regulator
VRCISKKPPASEGGPRRAHRRDVENSPLKRSACQLYGALCDCLDYTSYTGLAWPKVDTLARRMKVTSRTVQRALDDLIGAGWIGTPFGDAGGPREGVTYHLHPDGKLCLFCVAAARTISQRGGAHAPNSTGDKKSPVTQATGDILTPVTPDNLPPLPAPTGDILAATGDIFDSTYKEKNSLSNLPKSSTTTTPTAELASTNPPEEFLQIMDAYLELDESALRRLWRDARQIVPDATPEEVRHFFGERAQKVFRNRRVESPIGLLLSSIADWFVKRRVLQRREEQCRAAEEYEILKRQLADLEQPQRPPKQISPEPQVQLEITAVPAPNECFDMTAEVRAAAARKAIR